MNFSVKELVWEAKVAFCLSIGFSKQGNNEDAFFQYGRGKALMQVLTMVTGWNINDFAPELKEADDKAWRKLHMEVEA